MAKMYVCPEENCGQSVRYQDRYGHRDMHMQQNLQRFYSENAIEIIESDVIPSAIKNQVKDVIHYDLPDEIPDFVKEVL